jgi:stalled ribosome alternative rescue factor ArfA
MKERNPYWKILRAMKYKIVRSQKGKGSYTRKLKHKKEKDYG